jgi:GWxTD domain-containing protein
MKSNYKLVGIAILLLFINPIMAQKNFNKVNFAEMYNNGLQLHPRFQCFHQNDSLSTLFYEIDLSELTYVNEIENVYSASAKIHYEIYYNYKAKDLVDSGSFRFNDRANYGKDISTIGKFNFSLKQGYSYLMLLEYTDLNNKYSVKKLLEVDKANINSAENYYLSDSDELPLLQNYVGKSQGFYVHFRQDSVETFKMYAFKSNPQVASPPMHNYPMQKRIAKAESVLSLNAKNKKSGMIALEEPGIYTLVNDTTQSKGINLFRFANTYPYITAPLQMIMPLRYIASNEEYEKILKSTDHQKAMEAFWINITGDKGRAKNMIKLYYNRVQNANIHFASDREGWMTDRGMIYIVFGTPDIMFKDQQIETWQYTDHQSQQTITLNFIRAENQFSNNDFVLDRNSQYNLVWYNAISIWRK